MIKKFHACNKMNCSSSVNEVIRAVLNSLLFFFYKKISHAPKAPKASKAQKAQKCNQAKNKTQISEQK